jgi:ANTAR domain
MREIEDAVGNIIPSDEPAVVLSSLARSSNPSFSDACAIELSEGTAAPFRVCFPMTGEGEFLASARPVPAAADAPPVVMNSIITTFQAGSGYGYPSFAGIVVHSWAERDPTEDDAIMARLLVDRALAVVQHERLAQAAARTDRRAAKLAIDLITSRIEGEATGILMAKHQITQAKAASLLRQASQTRQRDLHEIAVGVVRAGDLDSLSHSNANSPARLRYLHIAASPDQPCTRTVRDPASHPERSLWPDLARPAIRPQPRLQTIGRIFCASATGADYTVLSPSATSAMGLLSVAPRCRATRAGKGRPPRAIGTPTDVPRHTSSHA